MSIAAATSPSSAATSSGYRIHFVDDDTAITCAKVGPPSKDPERWTARCLDEVNPETRLLGVATTFGGGWWDGRRRTQGYQGAACGALGVRRHRPARRRRVRRRRGVPADRLRGGRGARVVGSGGRCRCRPAKAARRATFVILGVAELGEGWVRGRPNAAATMGTARRAPRRHRVPGRHDRLADPGAAQSRTWRRSHATWSTACACPALACSARCRIAAAACSRQWATRVTFHADTGARAAPTDCLGLAGRRRQPSAASRSAAACADAGAVDFVYRQRAVAGREGRRSASAPARCCRCRAEEMR